MTKDILISKTLSILFLKKWWMLITGLFFMSSCRWGVDMEACYRLQDGDWRGLLITEGGDLPF
ncbi:MAG: hypothetical protein FJ343_02965, partial [Sphingomonadales bacterium]|nr:hypothetical protein [Sphingomonadales bacterium]